MATPPLDEVAGRVLLDEARAAMAHAHAPYSRFAVGAAVLLADGSVVRGANFENASYGLSLCAETVALAAANSAGRLREVVAIGVVGGALEGTPSRAPVRPCGRCRQVLNEAAALAGRDIAVFCGSAIGEAIERHMLSDLLPLAFGPKDLREG